LKTFTETDTSVEWSIVAAGISPGGIHEELAFEMVGTPIDKNTGEAVSTISITDNSVHAKSEERGRIIRNIPSIVAPAGAIDGFLSTEQEFVVRADIVFNSTIADEGKSATIDLPFEYELKEGEQYKVDLSTGGVAEWTVIAPDRDRTEPHYITVTAGGYDRNSQQLVELESDPIELRLNERTNLAMTVQILKSGGAPGDTLSVRQEFRLQAIINNLGDALAVGGGRIVLEGIDENDALGYTNSSQEDTLEFTIGEPVVWELEVIELPDGLAGFNSQILQVMNELEKENKRVKNRIASESGSKNNRLRELYNQMSDLIQALETREMNLTLRMVDAPLDENTNQTAFTEDSVVTKSLFIQPEASITIQAFDHPLTVSTSQEFDVVVSAIPIENVYESKAHLSIPMSFATANNGNDVFILPLDESTYQATFRIKVPITENYSGLARDSLKVIVTGLDRNSDEPITSLEVSKVITIELRPEIYMGYEILSPIAAIETGSLSHGQTITIEVWPELVPNHSTFSYADIEGDGNIELDREIISVYGFESIDGELKKKFDYLGHKLSFTLRAPRENKTALFNFKYVDLPKDSNSLLTVSVNNDSGLVSLPMSVVEKKITVIMDNNIEKKTFTRGEGQHLMMAFDISNEDYLDSLMVKGLGLKFITRSDTAALSIDAIKNIFDRITVINADDLSEGSDKISSITSFVDFEVNDETAANPLQIDFDQLEILQGEDIKKLAIVATFRKGESSRSFRTILNNVDAFDDSPDHLVSIVDEEGRSIDGNMNFWSDIFSIISTDQEETFGNFPNPFGRAPNETTDIRFVLNSTSDVTLRVFSLAGELVRSAWDRNLTNLPGGEIYYVPWDGKNDEGDTVLNGVYICIIEIRGSEGGKTYSTKIAYIK
jgi:hypothetical protein